MKVFVIFLIVSVTFAAFANADEDKNRICYKCHETSPHHNYKPCGRCEDDSFDLEKVYRGGSWITCCNAAREQTTKKFQGGYSDGDQDA
jgi:hypothetical protein